MVLRRVDGGLQYMVCTGGSLLHSRIASRDNRCPLGTPTRRSAKDKTRKALDGLDQEHKNGIVHVSRLRHDRYATEKRKMDTVRVPAMRK